MPCIRTLTTLVLLTSTFALAGCDDGEMSGGMMANADDATTGGEPTPSSSTTGDAVMPADDATTSPAPEPGTSTGEAQSSSSDESSTGTLATAGNSRRFEDEVTASGMQMLRDLETGLLWVNDSNACNPLGAPTMDTPTQAMTYCNDLMFGGFDDWRMPTVDEASELITAALDDGVDLIYQNPGCPAVIAMGGAAVQTHNGDEPGAVTDMPPSLGVRCVRRAE